MIRRDNEEDIPEEEEEEDTPWYETLLESIKSINKESLTDPILEIFDIAEIPGYSAPPYICKVCGESFDDTDEYIIHTMSHIKAYEESWFGSNDGKENQS